MNPDSLIVGDCLEVMSEWPAGCVDLIMTSPPYATKTSRYGSKSKMTWSEWSDWMTDVVTLCCSVCRGYVIVVANNPVVKGEELPANEKLRLSCRERGIAFERTVIWHKNSAPNKRPWWVNDWEPVMAFYKPPRPAVWNWESVAKPPKYSKGGAFRQRTSDGSRRAGSSYPQSKLARPRDVLRVTVGGGHLGSDLASRNEAPFPMKLVEPFVLALSNPGDIVCDPFCGSSTTGAVAMFNNRRYIGIDNRESQIALSAKRIDLATKQLDSETFDFGIT